MISISMGQHMTMNQENDSLILYSPLFMQGLSLGLVSPMGQHGVLNGRFSTKLDFDNFEFHVSFP